MKSRKKIETACKIAGFEIKSLDYSREYVPTPEEMVPVGWILIVMMNPEYPDDLMEITGDVEDVLYFIDYYNDYEKE